MGLGDPGRDASGSGGSTTLVVAVLLSVLMATPGIGAVAATSGSEGATSESGPATSGTEAPTSGTGAAVSGTTDGDVGDPQRASAPPTACFVGEGYPLSIGDGSTTIDAVVHASMLTDPAAGNEFGVELAGSLDGDPIVTLAAGVRFDAPGLLTTGMNPFAAFDLLYTYELRLPMFDGAIGDSEHREDGPPVGSAAEMVPC